MIGIATEIADFSYTSGLLLVSEVYPRRNPGDGKKQMSTIQTEQIGTAISKWQWSTFLADATLSRSDCHRFLVASVGSPFIRHDLANCIQLLAKE